MALTKEGGIEIFTANVEYGQGTNTILPQIAAETCRIPADLIEVHQPDTAVVPNSGPTVASRTTMVVRSEEHTSELQSHSDLVCRLLLEKKKNKKTKIKTQKK